MGERSIAYFSQLSAEVVDPTQSNAIDGVLNRVDGNGLLVEVSWNEAWGFFEDICTQAGMTPEQQILFTLRCIGMNGEPLTYSQLARKSGCSVSRVRKILDRAGEKLIQSVKQTEHPTIDSQPKIRQ